MKHIDDGFDYYSVCFIERGFPSKGYSYKTMMSLKPEAVVLVPTGNFYSVGKVIKKLSSEDIQKLNSDIEYKTIIADVTALVKQ